MKNILAENMLRFGAKNLKTSDIRRIEAALNEQETPATTSFTTLESCWADPRLKTDITVNAKDMQLGISREEKYNRILFENLVNYYGDGTKLIGREAVMWTPQLPGSSKEFLLQDATRFSIAEVYNGFNHDFQNSTFTPSSEPCIFITNIATQVNTKYPHLGSLYVSQTDFDIEDKTKNYKLLGVPNVPHIRLIGSKAYYFKDKITSNFPKHLVTTPLTNQKIISTLNV